MTTKFLLKNCVGLLVGLALLAGVVGAATAANPPSVKLTAAERDWLSANPDKLTLCFNTTFAPIEFMSSSGQFAGMSADIIAAIEKRLGVTFIARPSSARNTNLDDMESGACAVAPAAVHLPDRDRYAFFTSPYITVPVVIITPRSVSGNLTLDDLRGRRVGVVSGLAVAQYVRDRCADRFRVISVPTISEGLHEVAFGQLDALVANLAVAAYTISQEGIPNLRLAGKTDYVFTWRIAVSKKYPLLYSAIQKALDSIPDTDMKAIHQRWIYLKGNDGMNPETLKFIEITALCAALLLLSLAVITFFLKRRLNEKVAGLQKSERKYRELVESANSIILRMDAGYHITFFNEFAQRFFGFQESEILGRHVIGAIIAPTDSNGNDMNVVLDKISSNTSMLFRNENENILRNGARVWIAWTNKPIFDEAGNLEEILCIGNDITELKRHEEERALLSTVIEQAEENVLITDQHRTIIYVNPAFERSSGYRWDELKGQKLKKLRSDRHDENFYRNEKEILDRGDVWMGLIINRGKDGKDFEIEGTISPIRDASGAVSHFVAVGRNTSRFRKLEKELQQAQKLDALGTLAGGIAHDFNNVLAAIIGNVEMEVRQAEAGSPTHIRMTQALSACHRARDLIKQILSFSRRNDEGHAPIELAPIVEDVLQMLRATLPTTIEIRLDIQTTHSVISGNITHIHQVLVNLCTNAGHAMRRNTGGILEIRLDDVEIGVDTATEHLDLRPGPYVRLTVRDTGHGMDQATLNRIFDPFFTTKGPGEGSGIGLSVVHGIVKSHDGRITVYSQPGQGATFQIFFPKIHEKTGVVPTIAPSGDTPCPTISTRTGRILLVDDEEILIAVVTEMLKVLGYEVISANRGPDALYIFKSRPESFNLVITDFTMPEITGMELAAELLQIRSDIPIILSTGFASAEMREKALAIGIRDVMTKPFVLQELAEAVGRILAGKNCSTSD